jgi:hypothetical protein
MNKNTQRQDGIELNADGTIIKPDSLDLGVPMRPAPEGWVHSGPEDALDPNPTRGDYRDRLGGTHHTTSKAERKGRYDLEPRISAVSQNEYANSIVDVAGPLDAADPQYDAKLKARQSREKAK